MSEEGFLTTTFAGAFLAPELEGAVGGGAVVMFPLFNHQGLGGTDNSRSRSTMVGGFFAGTFGRVKVVQLALALQRSRTKVVSSGPLPLSLQEWVPVLGYQSLMR